MTTYARVADVPVRVESYVLDGIALELPYFTRRTTVVRLRGSGAEGIGEDVTYEEASQLAFQEAGPELELAGEHTLDSFSRLLPDDLPDYRRWAFESAALDLALRQAGRSLADAVGRTPRPVRFVVSTRTAFREWLALYPGLRFKLDAEAGWTDEVARELAATGAIDVVDLKGFYRGTPVDLAPDAVLYRRVAETFPDAWIEDAWLEGDTAEALEPFRDRLTWDAPIHSVGDIDGLSFPPRMLNIKPSRFGTVRRLFDAYDACDERGIGMYGGGQFELGPGRGQIQYLASLFHADAPNDVAPREYNTGGPRPGLPESPLAPSAAPTGFRWGDE